ncbi:unnamed protein product [Adineta ricciae]|uniref:Uncharacterized protein n=1 Tax=Adineta ricciae TaxID=249248 RepID=A0A815TYH3_ADIRI|nr:unnamed protein product [Adineta ricciae]CAF1508487.1 unnamed protein product [Adineta ricciae]
MLGLVTTMTTTTTTTTTTSPMCVPFWSMPSTDQGTYLTYPNANTLISGYLSRSVCATFRASAANVDNIIFAIGSSFSTATGGCNEHFALSVINASYVTVYGMCGPYDNSYIYTGQNTLYDGYFHQICVTYDNSDVQLCIYLDSSPPQCLIRTNPHYNTSLGDVRIGWWPDLNRNFTATGGGLIKWVSLFDKAINQSCVAYQYQNNFSG